MSNRSYMSSELSHYIRVKVGECQSKEEEDLHVSADLLALRAEISKPHLSDRQCWELIMRLLYAEMLGHATDFAHFFVVNCAQRPAYRVKRVAYLAAGLLVPETSQLRIMLVASLQKDLTSACLYNKLIALNALTKLACAANAAAFAEPLAAQLSSLTPLVRRKSLLVLTRLERVAPGAVERFPALMEAGLRDGDAAVVAAATPFFFERLAAAGAAEAGLVEALLAGLQLLLERKAAKEADYEGHALPWTSIKLLECLALACGKAKARSEPVYAPLNALLSSFFALTTDVDAALLFQAVMAALQLYPHAPTLALCRDKLALLHRSAALRPADRLVLVVRALGRFVEVDPIAAEDYHVLLLECLESTDETLRQLTLEVLFKTISAKNVETVVARVFACLAGLSDPQKSAVAARLYDVVEQRAPDAAWFAANALAVLVLGAAQLPPRVFHATLANLRDIVRDNPAELVALHNAISCRAGEGACEPVAAVLVWFLGSFAAQLVGRGLTAAGLSAAVRSVAERRGEGLALRLALSAAAKLRAAGIDVTWLAALPRPDDADARARLAQTQRLPRMDFSAVAADPALSFLDDYIQKGVMRTGRVFDPTARREAAAPAEAGLSVAYSAEQLQRSVQPALPPDEKVVYNGRKRWGPPESPARPPVAESVMLEAPPAPQLRQKQSAHKERLAASLFGAGDEQVKAVGGASRRLFQPAVAAPALQPLHLQLRLYELKWEEGEAGEQELRLAWPGDFAQAQRQVRGLGFHVISAKDNELVGAARTEQHREALLYLQHLGAGAQEVLLRGDGQACRLARDLLIKQ